MVRTFSMPTIRSDLQGFEDLASLLADASDCQNENVAFDFSQCEFFDAHMAAAFKVILSKIEDRNNTIKIIKVPNSISAILQKNHFLSDYGFGKVWDVNKTTLPFRVFFPEDEHQFVEYLDEHLEGKGVPQMTPALTKRFRQSIFEIFANCGMHANSKRGIFVCGQFYPRKYHLDLTMSDVGVGIRTNVRKIIPKISSTKAIEWALQEGNTTKTGAQPGGFGLKLLQEFVELNKGKVQIISRQGYYEFSGGTPKYFLMNYDMPGTTINFEIKTNDNNSYCLRSEISPSELF